MSLSNKTIQIIIAYFFIYVVWGSTYFFIGVALKGFPPFLLGAIRFSIAGLLLLSWCILKGEPAFKKRLMKRSAISGVVLLFIDMAVVMLAQQYLSSSLVAIIASSTVIWIFLLDMPMWKTNFNRWNVLVGLIIGFAGVMLLFIEQFKIQDHSNPYGVYGILLLIFGCISWALGSLYAKYRSSHEEEQNAFAGTSWQMLSASALFWIFASIRGEISSTDFSSIPTSAWLSLVYLIVLGSIFAYSSYVWLLKIRPAAEVGTHAYVNPVIAVFIGTTFGNEHVTFIQIAGMVIILTSIMLVNKRLKKQ